MFSWFKKKAAKQAAPAGEATISTNTDAAPTAEEIQQIIAEMPGHAESHRELTKEMFGANLDYSAESIRKLDEVIEEGWSEPPTFLEPLVLTFGAYLGETIKRLHGGTWDYSEEYGVHLKDIGGIDMTIFPLAKVRKRFTNGEEDSLDFYYAVIRQRLLEPQEPAED